MKGAAAAALLLLAAAPGARSQPVQGVYLQGNAGALLQPGTSLNAATPPSSAGNAQPDAAARAARAIETPPAAAESGSLGYGFGDGLRVEVQALHATQSFSGP